MTKHFTPDDQLALLISASWDAYDNYRKAESVKQRMVVALHEDRPTDTPEFEDCANRAVGAYNDWLNANAKLDAYLEAHI